jgi:transcriptional regulator with XRE-family HTH domain
LELRIGQKIKTLRLASDLTQTELADRANLTKGFISQLENDQCSISVDSLADIIDALGVSLQEFFGDKSDPEVVFAPDDRVAVEGKGASRFELLVPGSTNNEMDPIMVELNPGQRLEAFDPHPGEQFGYVLKGEATLKLGKKEYRVRANHCFYFEADQSSQIMNKSHSSVRLLWVTAPPQM